MAFPKGGRAWSKGLTKEIHPSIMRISVAMSQYRKGKSLSAEQKAKMSAHFKGKPLSAEHRAAIGAALRGRKKSPEHIEKVRLAILGRPSPMLGRKHSLETRQLMSEIRKERYGVPITSHHLRDVFGHKEWRAQIYIRDSWICQVCEQVGGRLQAHHIKEVKKYPELLLSLDNGVTLCYKCHRLVHALAAKSKRREFGENLKTIMVYGNTEPSRQLISKLLEGVEVSPEIMGMSAATQKVRDDPSLQETVRSWN